MNLANPILLLILIPLASSPIIYLVGRISFRTTGKAGISHWLGLIALLATAIPLYSAAQTFLADGTVSVSVNMIGLKFDGISLLMSFGTLVLGILVTLFSMTYMAGEEGEEKFYALLTAMIGTIIGLCTTNDLFNLWVWFETMAVTSYMLVAFYRNQAGALEAGVKYLVQSAVGSTFVLLGIGLVFAQTGSLDLSVISANAQPSALLLGAGALFLIGFGVKSALVPLHTWLPDAHSQAPSGISAMLSGVVIEAGMIAMLRSLGCLNSSSSSWGYLLLGFGALNMLVGNLMALRQDQIKRLLAYSSVSHMGYILFGLGIAVAFNLADAAAGSFFHLLVHILMKGLAFLAAGSLLYALHLANGSHKALTKEDINGASKRYPLAAFAFSVAILSLGALPPLAGFMSKWQIVLGAVETKNTTILWLTLFMALNSVLSLGYYAPLVNRIYRRESSEVVNSGKSISISMSIPLVILTLAIAVLGFWPSLVTWLTNPAAASLLAVFGFGG